MNGGGMSPIRIDYSCSVAVMYGGGVSTVRIDDNSMLCICGQTHHAQKTEKYASHDDGCDSYMLSILFNGENIAN